MKNAEIALHFDELGDLYELDGAIIHRVVAYRNAAKAIRESSASIEELTRAGKVTELAGIGKTIEEKINALLDTGEIPAATKLKARYPPGLVEITRIPGLGAKKTRKLFDELGIDSIDKLRAAAEGEQIRGLRGFGAKAEESILAALAAGEDGRPKQRILLSKALGIADALASALREHPACDKVQVAGSARRMAETVKDIDLIATSSDPAALSSAFCGLALIAEASRSGEAAARALTHNGLAVDLRIVAPEAFGNLLQHLTGSKQHNEALRTEAVKRGLHVSEYGILDDSDEITRTCATEEEVYELLGMDWIPPELRENRGELKAARAHELPRLIEEGDLKGELHCHTVASDGRQTIEQMAEAARERGYEYIVITDHSATHGFGNDVSPEQLREQIERVREIDAGLDGIRVLIGTETNILTDGSPDYDDDLLAELDWVIGSVHTSFGMAEAEMTKRIVTACEHPWIDAIGHPTGRKIERRKPYAVDMNEVIAAAARTGTMLESNASPDRRDPNAVRARNAAEAGVPILVDSDAHGIRELALVRWGIATARRAWIGPESIANTRSWDELDG